MKRNIDRFVTGIFCDDIRHEMGNKLSFMGCYQSELIVPSMPTVLSKLCIHVSACTPKPKPFKALTLRLLQDDDKELARIEVPAEGLTDSPQSHDETATRITVSTAIVFSPFVIEKLTSLRLMATTEEGDIVGPRLMIKTLPKQEIEPPPPSQMAKPASQRTSKRKPAVKKTGAKT